MPFKSLLIWLAESACTKCGCKPSCKWLNKKSNTNKTFDIENKEKKLTKTCANIINTIPRRKQIAIAVKLALTVGCLASKLFAFVFF